MSPVVGDVPGRVPKSYPAVRFLRAEHNGRKPWFQGCIKPDGSGRADAEQFAKANAIAIEAGQQIAHICEALGKRERSKIALIFRRQLFPPGKPGRRRSNRITAALADWKSGVTGLELYRRHIPRFDKMDYWKRKVKMRALMDAIRSRDRRTRKQGHPKSAND